MDVAKWMKATASLRPDAPFAEENDEPLWEPVEGERLHQPTRRHLALIVWAYTPDLLRYLRWLESL